MLEWWLLQQQPRRVLACMPCCPLPCAALAAALSHRRHFNENWAELSLSAPSAARSIRVAEGLQYEQRHKTHQWGCRLPEKLQHLHREPVSEQLQLLLFNTHYRSNEGGL